MSTLSETSHPPFLVIPCCWQFVGLPHVPTLTFLDAGSTFPLLFTVPAWYRHVPSTATFAANRPFLVFQRRDGDLSRDTCLQHLLDDLPVEFS